VQQPGTLPPEALSCDPAASAQGVSAALRRLTEPPTRGLAGALLSLARDEQNQLAMAERLLHPVLREALVTRLQMNKSLEARMDHWLSAEAFRGEIPRLMQGALIQHLQSTQAMRHLLQNADQRQLAHIMMRWQTTHHAVKLALRDAPPGPETQHYRHRLTTWMAAFNRADTLRSCEATLDNLWGCISALKQHTSSQRAATDPRASPGQALTRPSTSGSLSQRDHGINRGIDPGIDPGIDLGVDLDLASVAEANPMPPEARRRRLPALLESPPDMSTADLLQPPTDLERPWRQPGSSRPAIESTRL
jgi:hypothetical protein